MPDPQIETVDHPVLGPLKFPVDMGPDERNEAIDRAMMDKAKNPAASVQGPDLGNMIQGDESRSRTAALPGGSPNVIPASDTALGIAGAGIGAAGLAVGGPPAYRAVASAAVKHPLIAQTIASQAIAQARNIPYLGKYIPPYSEMLPYLLPHKGAQEEPAAEQPPVKPRSAAPPAEYPPAEPPRVLRMQPEPGSPEDFAETKDIQGQVRDAAEAEDRNRLLAIQRDRFPFRTKFDLTNAPVKFTKTPGVNATAPKPGTVVPEANQDLTPLLRRSLRLAKKAKD